MTDDAFTNVDALIAAIDHVTETDATPPAENILASRISARLDALSISATSIHALELTSEDETELLDHLVTQHLPQLTFHLAGVGFWVAEDSDGPTNFTAATLARWLLVDVAQGDVDATPDDRAHAATIRTDPRLFPTFSGACLITGIDATQPIPLDTSFTTWFSGKLRTVGQQRDTMMGDLLSGLGLPRTNS
jgi:hypothetical protein